MRKKGKREVKMVKRSKRILVILAEIEQVLISFGLLQHFLQSFHFKNRIRD